MDGTTEVLVMVAVVVKTKCVKKIQGTYQTDCGTIMPTDGAWSQDDSNCKSVTGLPVFFEVVNTENTDCCCGPVVLLQENEV